MKRYLTIVVCAAACLLTLGACDSHLRNSPEDLQLPRSTTDKQLAQKVKGLTNLEKLGLIGCSNITDAGLAHLEGLTKLEWLSLNGCTKITDAGLAHLKGLTKLRWLYLYNCVLITDAAISKLKKALPNCDIERVGQRDSSRQRRTVRLPGSTTDKQLAQKVKGLTKLAWLDLTYCTKITDAGLVHLKGLTNLEWLNLKLCRQITDAGLAHLKGLTKLTLLNLAGCDQITDAGLAHLKGLTKLKALNLDGCDKITDAAVSKLEKALPNCKIYRPR